MLVIPSNLNLQVQFDLGAWLWVWGTWLPTWALLWAARATDSTALDDQSAMLIHFSWFYFENVRSTPNLRLQVTYLYSTPATNSIYIYIVYIFICIYTYIYIAYMHMYAHKHDTIYLILVLWTYMTSSAFRTDSGSLGCSWGEPQRNMFGNPFLCQQGGCIVHWPWRYFWGHWLLFVFLLGQWANPI